MILRRLNIGICCTFVTDMGFCKMESNSYAAAKQILNNYIEQNKCRKTPERFAVLEAVYGFASYFPYRNLANVWKKIIFL